MLNYDYSGAADYCKEIGLVWMGEDWVRDFDAHAVAHHFTQAQVDLCLHHHLLQVKHLFTPQIYNWKQRIALAVYFLLGRMK